MNEPVPFIQGSSLHFAVLAGCLVLGGLTAVAALRDRRKGVPVSTARKVVAVGCVVTWVLSIGYGFLPSEFAWDKALPLQFCNLANLIGAHAVMTRHRTSQTLIYFWAFALCLWAFLTQSLYVGPDHPWFWIFWIYHSFILNSVIWVLVADRFRPSWSDYRIACLLTLAYMGALVPLNYFTGWNYGFVGPSIPTQKNLLDFLGPYPIRLLWMVLIGLVLFALLVVPWLRPGRTRAI